MRATLVLASLLAAAPARALSYKGADLYRSDAVTVEAALEKVGPLVDSYLRARQGSARNRDKVLERLREQIEGELRKLAPFAFVSFHFGEYVSSSERSAYVTFDVVDAAHAPARMPFRPAPKESPADPDGLLADWYKYEELGRGLLRRGISAAERARCPSFYCPWGASTPELSALEERFAAGARARRDALLAVLQRSADPAQRAAAVYVLSFLNDADFVTEALHLALADPHAEVRAAALNVFSDIALYHKKVFVDASRIIPVLDFPTSSDRGKALALLVGLAHNPVYRPYILARSGPSLLRLLKLQQPGQHDLAFTLLSVLSQESYDRRDYESWERWVRKAAADARP